MTNEDEQLARRALACPGWRRTRGMRGFLKTMVLRLVAYPGPGGLTHTLGYVDDGEPEGPDVGPVWLPDFSDPPTLGCLLALVREAWGDPGLTAVFRYGFWELFSKSALVCSPRVATEAAALVAALEAAPTRTLALAEDFSREETDAISLSIEAEAEIAADMEGKP